MTTTINERRTARLRELEARDPFNLTPNERQELNYLRSVLGQRPPTARTISVVGDADNAPAA